MNNFGSGEAGALPSDFDLPDLTPIDPGLEAALFSFNDNYPGQFLAPQAQTEQLTPQPQNLHHASQTDVTSVRPTPNYQHEYSSAVSEQAPATRTNLPSPAALSVQYNNSAPPAAYATHTVPYPDPHQQWLAAQYQHQHQHQSWRYQQQHQQHQQPQQWHLQPSQWSNHPSQFQYPPQHALEISPRYPPGTDPRWNHQNSATEFQAPAAPMVIGPRTNPVQPDVAAMRCAQQTSASSFTEYASPSHENAHGARTRESGSSHAATSQEPSDDAAKSLQRYTAYFQKHNGSRFEDVEEANKFIAKVTVRDYPTTRKENVKPIKDNIVKHRDRIMHAILKVHFGVVTLPNKEKTTVSDPKERDLQQETQIKKIVTALAATAPKLPSPKPDGEPKDLDKDERENYGLLKALAFVEQLLSLAVNSSTQGVQFPLGSQGEEKSIVMDKDLKVEDRLNAIVTVLEYCKCLSLNVITGKMHAQLVANPWSCLLKKMTTLKGNAQKKHKKGSQTGGQSSQNGAIVRALETHENDVIPQQGPSRGSTKRKRGDEDGQPDGKRARSSEPE